MKKLSRSNLDALFAAIADTKKLYLPVADGEDEKRGAKYAVWTPGTEYSTAVNTIRSAKDFFFPQVERMANFKLEGKTIEIDDIREECEDFVVFGVRACDAASFQILDSVYLAEPVDSYYQNRREHGVIMTMACGKPSETCFCSVFGIDASEPAGDISCWMTDDEILMQANTEKGEALLASLSMLEDAADQAADDVKALIRTVLEKLPLKDLSTKSFGGDKLMELFHSEKWAELSQACLGCGTCTFVCPTCQCYDIRDFDTGHGVQRFRCWDSCMYSDFTKTAGGQPRPTQVERFRQRFMHKLVYHPANHEGTFGCVGCGRCMKSCPISMNIVKAMKTLGEDHE
ncbi:MAG: 4Fe-4S dicluster domain-containing protein [Ruminococcus sp.]|nr:4Fe-4S dicluster domain-containing protein [Ruminococcus sp.]